MSLHVATLFLAALVLASPAAAHRSGCHRWHSCPSDTGSYVCDELGHCDQCPDNEYCRNSRPRAATLPVPSPVVRPAPPVLPPRPEQPARAPALGATLRRETATVLRVVDGDTVDVEVDGRRERLRLVGLRTPETVDPRRPVECFGREASAKAKTLLPEGTAVQVELDACQGRLGCYGRLVAYLVLPDGRNFADVMIAGGYGHDDTFRLPYRDQDQFKPAPRAAGETGQGLWAVGACS